jgi:hypothetical protein
MTERDARIEGLLERAWAAAQTRKDALDPKVQRARGVVHTPPALARYVVRRLGQLLQEAMGRALADPSIIYVDPSVGTGIFPAALAEIAGAVRVIGFDVDGDAITEARALLAPMAPTLIVASPLASLTPHPILSPDADGPLVVLGNPPWAGRSASRGDPLSDAMVADFDRDEHGASLGEKKKGVLSDDYVRFVRWALEVVSQRRDGGAMALLTNASWLDGPVHRGMRRVLLERLSVLEVLDLGGSALTSRPAGLRDENLFGVRPGAALLLGACGRPSKQVRFGALTGSRADKVAVLEGAEPLTGPVHPEPPQYRFAPRANVPRAYREAPSIADWLPFHREGLQTNRDALVIDRDRTVLADRAQRVAAGELPLEARAHFDPDHARAELRAELASDPPRVLRVAYRPFDDRYYLASRVMCHRPRPELARAIGQSGLVLVTTRQDRGRMPFQHLLLTRFMPDNCVLSLRSSCRARGFPTHDPDGAPNLGAEVRQRVEERLDRSPSPIEVLLWLAAHLGAPRYTASLDEALRSDFPRVPLPADAAHWDAAITAAGALRDAFLDPLFDPASAEASPTDSAIWIGHHRVSGPAAIRLAQARAQLDTAIRHIV